MKGADMRDLKKCPFCGSEARMVENHDWGTVYIRCADEFGTCSVLPCTEDLYHIHEVENEWNSRAMEQEIRNKAIDEFVERVKCICGNRPIGCDCKKNRPLYAHTDGKWHDLIDEIAEEMRGAV